MKLITPRLGAIGAGTLTATALVGCSMPNSSNPTLSITEARVAGDTASLRMQIDNPSDMDLQIESADWSLLYGPLPVAEGSWELGFLVPSGGSYRFDRSVRFDSPPLDPGAGEVELTGTLDVQTVGNSGNTALQGAGFSAIKTTSR
ncbi:MAG: LEA type 2 family protein [Phycisphaerales bacterium]